MKAGRVQVKRMDAVRRVSGREGGGRKEDRYVRVAELLELGSEKLRSQYTAFPFAMHERS